MYCMEVTPGLDPFQAGNKAATLGRLMELGVQVPPGFVVGRTALARFLGAAGLSGRVDD